MLTQRMVGLGAIVASRTDADVLVAHALGSCVAVCLYDPGNRAGAMVHVVLPEGDGRRGRSPGMHMTTAVPAAVRALTELGCKKRSLLAGIAGGAAMFSPDTDLFAVGQRNAEAAHRILAEHRIPLMLADTGGTLPRTAMLEIESGTLIVCQVGLPPHARKAGAQHGGQPRIARLGAVDPASGSTGGVGPRVPANPLYKDPNPRR